MVPAFVVVALGVNATNALVLSQVVLSFALPVPMIAVLMFTRRADIMGEFVNSGPVTRIGALDRHRRGARAQCDPAGADLWPADPVPGLMRTTLRSADERRFRRCHVRDRSDRDL